jgi:hypothetical protein
MTDASTSNYDRRRPAAHPGAAASGAFSRKDE